MLSNSQPCARVPSVKFAATTHQRFPPEQPKHRLIHDQREAEGPQNSGSNLADQGSRRTLSAADEERRLRILSVTQPGKYPMLSRACPERDGLLGHPSSKHAQAQRSRSLKLQAPLLAPIQPSQSAARTDRRPALRVQTEPVPRQIWKKKTKHVYAPCHSRAPLAPFLCAPARILSSLSRLNPGGSIKTIQQKVHRSILPENRKVTTTSSPHCSVKIQKAVSKHRVKAHDEDNQVLQGFLKNNGRYLEDCDPEAEHVAEETPQLDNQKNTLLKRIPYTLQFRSPIRSSSVGSSQSSSSSNSKNTN